MLVGRIVKDPNVFQTSLGVKYARFRIAVNRPVARNQADFVPIVVLASASWIRGKIP
ncbi:single-stranded DNA-binding protein [Mycoplasma sp. ATU-Cv-508]|uniref:single-stranded DNA-binding protein n=1 Tax=Mycoplasma sp. ATU-Cv-508 TaxID=2048001 RepID=UPI0013749C1B